MGFPDRSRGLRSRAPATASVQDAASDDELDRHLATVREQITGKFLDLSVREDRLLDMAATLDRAAQAAASAQKRRLRWAQAIELFDAFLGENVEPPRACEMRFQGGVYRWAQAQSWIQSGQASLDDSRPRKEAVAALDDAIARFRSVGSVADKPALADNLRFRLAESLADRASLEPVDSPGRRSRESEAVDLLAQPPGDSSALAGFWLLLKADLLRRLGKPEEAATQLDAAVKSPSAPPASEIAEVKLPLLLDRKKYPEAIEFLKTAQVNAPAKELWIVRTRLAQLAGLPSGPARMAAETDLFRAIGELRKNPSFESRAALLELAASRLSPGAAHPPEVWDSLAAAYERRGDPSTAGAQMTLAADRAAALGQADAAASFRLKAGGFLFQAGKFAEADSVLSIVADSPGPDSRRAKAGMLRAVARGRAAALHLPGASTAKYIAALEQQIRDFPKDPSTDEARWLLGKAAIASSGASEPRSSGLPSTRDPPTGSNPASPSSLSIAISSRSIKSAPIASAQPRSWPALAISPSRATSSRAPSRTRPSFCSSERGSTSLPAQTRRKPLATSAIRSPACRSPRCSLPRPAASSGRPGQAGALHRSRARSTEPSFLENPHRA